MNVVGRKHVQLNIATLVVPFDLQVSLNTWNDLWGIGIHTAYSVKHPKCEVSIF